MKKITFLTGPQVELTHTADDWQLYDIPGRDDVARKLNEELARRIAAAPTPVQFDHLNLLFPYAEFGAVDSEGRQHVGHVLEKVYPSQR